MKSIIVDKLSKKYRVGSKEEIQHKDTLFSTFLNIIKFPFKNYRKLIKLSKFSNKKERDVIWALKDVSFKLNQGEVLAVIGSNGAGKSTLLKLLSKITYPNSGQIKINGRISSLLEVGTGFHPDLTGRENIYLNGTILGMSKLEINNRFDEIVSFSGVAKFIDTPIKRYSSGMKVRLAFAVASHLDSEILFIDEVLAVGDLDFQKKCLQRMDNISDDGRTIIFVSHNMTALKSLCTRGIVLINGQLKYDGEINNAIDYYINQSVIKFDSKKSWSLDQAPGSDKLKILGCEVFSNKNNITISSGFKIKFICYNFLDNVSIDVSFEIYNLEGVKLVKNGCIIEQPQKIKKGIYKVIANFPPNILNKGIYKLKVWYGLSGKEKIAEIKEMLEFEIFDISNDQSLKSNNGVLRPKINFERQYRSE